MPWPWAPTPTPSITHQCPGLLSESGSPGSHPLLANDEAELQAYRLYERTHNTG